MIVISFILMQTANIGAVSCPFRTERTHLTFEAAKFQAEVLTTSVSGRDVSCCMIALGLRLAKDSLGPSGSVSIDKLKSYEVMVSVAVLSLCFTACL